MPAKLFWATLIIVILGCGGAGGFPTGIGQEGTIDLKHNGALGSPSISTTWGTTSSLYITIDLSGTNTVGFPDAIRFSEIGSNFQTIPDVTVTPPASGTTVSMSIPLVANSGNGAASGSFRAQAVFSGVADDSFGTAEIFYSITSVAASTQVLKDFNVTTVNQSPTLGDHTLTINLDQLLSPGEFCRFKIGTSSTSTVEIAYPDTDVQFNWPNPDDTSPTIRKEDVEVALLNPSQANDTVVQQEALFNNPGGTIHNRTLAGSFMHNGSSGTSSLVLVRVLNDFHQGIQAYGQRTEARLNITHPDGTESIVLNTAIPSSEFTFEGASTNFGNVRVWAHTLTATTLTYRVSFFFGTGMQDDFDIAVTL
ncbi:MAG: hypothetical protein KDC26_09280 [Armatimonadetes bacterium]|nr:hypothetical protein [Armatimonadota bacterium]